MARTQARSTPGPVQHPLEWARATQAAKPPALPPALPPDVRAQGGPTPKTLGAENAARLLQACHQLVEPIAAVSADLPDVGRALATLNGEVGKAALAQIRAESQFQQALRVNGAELDRGAQRFAAKLAAVDVNRAPTLADRANALRREAHQDWQARYETTQATLAAKVGSAIVSALDAAETALQKRELRAGLDDMAPDPKLVASVIRTVEAEPSLLRPAAAKGLLDRAMRLGDKPLLHALEALLPILQEVMERGVPALTRNATMQTGQPTDAMSNATAVVNMLRNLRSQRLSKPAIKRARELFEGLRWLALKTVGIDASDPASVSTLVPGQIKHDKITPDGARWVTRYIRSSAPLAWPRVLAPMPATGLTSNPPVVRKEIKPGHPLPVKPVPNPAKLK